MATPGQPNGFGTVGEFIYGGGKGLFLNAGRPGRSTVDAGSVSQVLLRSQGEQGGPGRGAGRTAGWDAVEHEHPDREVKSFPLMRWLCRLVTPPAGLILDPFCGSGSTGKAAVRENFRFIGIDRELEYLQIAAGRIHHADGGGGLFAKERPVPLSL
jgi:hypothetical protein